MLAGALDCFVGTTVGPVDPEAEVDVDGVVGGVVVGVGSGVGLTGGVLDGGGVVGLDVVGFGELGLVVLPGVLGFPGVLGVPDVLGVELLPGELDPDVPGAGLEGSAGLPLLLPVPPPGVLVEPSAGVSAFSPSLSSPTWAD